MLKLFLFLNILSFGALIRAQTGKFDKERLQDYLVQQHNAFRTTKLRFPASNMREMVWSNRLAELAEVLARKCIFEHDYDGYGQNIYMDWGYPRQITSDFVDGAFDSWAVKEMERDIPRVIASNPKVGDSIGKGIRDHYSQIVWANTYEVGCAYSLCSEKRRILVCNYYTPGNYIGQGWYYLGKPCSQCPEGTTCVQGLCSTRKQLPTMVSITQKPTHSTPTTPKPTTSIPTIQKPTTSKPERPEPTTPKPTKPKPTSNPTIQKPATSKPTASKPAKPEPTTPKPTTSNPTIQKPTTSKPTTSNLTKPKPTASKQAKPTTPKIAKLHCQF